MTSDDASAAMLAEMGACAHRLGVAFAREAERAEDWARKVACFDLFERCFFGVRVSVALGLRLRRAPAVAEAVSERPAASETERPENERPETGERLRERLDADRDREGERASLPLLLETLRGVAADPAALPGPPPPNLSADLSPELSALTALLARKAGEPGPAIRPPAAGGLRNRLSGSAALAIAPGPISTGPQGAGVAVLARRPHPATGPPRR